MKILIPFLAIFTISALSVAQKNLVVATQTQMLGIPLPEGSKQDKRLLAVAAAGSFLSMSTEYKNIEITPVEVYSIPAALGFSIEVVRSQLSANGYSVKFDNGDNKLHWFSRNTKNWLVYLSQEADGTNLYIGEGNVSNIIVDNPSQPIYVANTKPEQQNNNSSGIIPEYIPPLAGRQTIAQQKNSIPQNEDILQVYDLDGNRYEVMKIGEEFWFMENLRTTQYNDTTRIASGLNADEWSKVKHGAYSIYDDKTVNIKKYGLLYNGYAAASGKLCPLGWHVATDKDWNELERFYGISADELDKTGERGNIADKLKASEGWNTSAFTPKNYSGFSIVPAGSRKDNGEYTTEGQYGNFWTSTVYDDRYGLLYLWNHHVHYNTNAVGRIYTVAQNGYSCRCVKDKPRPEDGKKK